MRKRAIHISLTLKRERSSRAQKNAIPIRMIKHAGTATNAIGVSSTRSVTSPAGIDSTRSNHDVCIKAKISPMHTTTHDEYENKVRALFERSHLDIIGPPHITKDWTPVGLPMSE